MWYNKGDFSTSENQKSKKSYSSSSDFEKSKMGSSKSEGNRFITNQVYHKDFDTEDTKQ